LLRGVKKWGLGLICLALFYSLAAGSDKLLTIKEKIYPQAEKTYTSPVGAQFQSNVSQKNLLGLKRQTPYSLPEASSITIQPVTIKVLAARVTFQKEIPDDPTTTGDGTFDFRDTTQFKAEEGHLIDPAPHGKAYFESHLEALKNYWETVSKGKLIIEYDVLPAADTEVFQLPQSMAYYGQKPPVLGLSEFFRDTWELVDSLNPLLKFDFYQAFVIFHAGSDQQSNLSFSATPTPNDLFTGFIIMGEPVWVEGGLVPIEEGLIIPETVSQDTRIGALNAIFAHEFGHQLSLVDLYNTRNFFTQVGDFSLMDNNGADVGVDLGFRGPAFGTLPIYPEAWSRAYLGFDLPAEIQNQQDVLIKAAGLLSDSLQIVKIPINSQEYLLLENRYQDLDKDGSTNLKADPVTSVILGPGKLLAGIPVLTREYDVLLPGSGMLIWHVDEGVAYLDQNEDGLNNFLSNTLQWDKDRRFITLVEADGIIDFGGNYFAGFGSQVDMYYRENNSAFTPTTYPSSRSNTGADTHIKITGIGRRDTVMQCDIAVDLYQAGWPQRFKSDTNTSSLVAFDVDGDTIPELFLASGNRIYAWRKDGSKLISNADLDSLLIFDEEKLQTYPAAIFAETDAPIVGAPAVADLDGDGSQEVAAGTGSGNVYVWKTVDQNADGRADLLPSFPVTIFGSSLAHHLVVGNFESLPDSLEIFVATQDGHKYFLGVSGNVVGPILPLGGLSKGFALSSRPGSFYLIEEDNQNTLSGRGWTRTLPSADNFTPIVGDLNRDGVEDVVALSQNGYVSAYDSLGNLLTGFPVNLGETISSKPVLGDIDGDGYLEILFGGDNKIWALNYNGTVATDFPITVSRSAPVGPIATAPILVDINADGRTDVLIGSPGREILAYSGFAGKPSGFPLSTAAGVLTAGTVVNFDRTANNSERELAFAASDGFVYVWNITGSFTESKNFWVMENFDAQHSNLYPSAKLPPPPVAGVDLLPSGRFFSYPNPAASQAVVRYYLNYDAEVELKFFDLSGNLVQTHQTKGFASTDNEFNWNCSGLASGVYLCRIQAKSQGRSQTEFCKIAIVK